MLNLVSDVTFLESNFGVSTHPGTPCQRLYRTSMAEEYSRHVMRQSPKTSEREHSAPQDMIPCHES